jgi:hypothetical protein
LNSGLYTCKADVLLLKPHLQPSELYLNKVFFVKYQGENLLARWKKT